MKILTVIGARPQFIKAAEFSKIVRIKHNEILVHTGQHYSENMSDIFFNELSIPIPNYNLGVGSASHGKQTGRMIELLEDILLKEKPNIIVIFGDTNSTLAGAIAASKIHIPIAHIEAGLRSFNMKMPEEQNRVVSDHLSKFLFCPTSTAVRNLANEGIIKGVYNVGDIMLDAVINNINKAKQLYNFNHVNELLLNNKNIIKEKNYYLSTIHRAENTDDPTKLYTILSSFEQLNLPVILPMHPRTQKLISNSPFLYKNIQIIEPIGYLLMLYLVSNAKMVITDSGGLQKEAFLLKTPCTTLRDETEWIETLENNWNTLCSNNTEDFLSKVNRTNIGPYPGNNKFGYGDTTQKIIEIIEREIENEY